MSDFCLSGKCLTSPSNLEESFLACRVSVEKSANSLMEVPLCVICCFSLVALHILSVINFCQFDYYVSLFLLGFILPGTLWDSWTWLTISFPMLGKFSAIIFSNIFSGTFSLSSPSGTPIM